MTTVAQTQVEAAQNAWDHFDLDLVRNVSWLAIPAIGKQTHSFMPTGGISTYLNQLLVESFPGERDLVGAAIVCGDMEAERGLFQYMSAVRFRDVVGFDLSEASLKRARPAPFYFHAVQGDCNDLVLDAGQFHMAVGMHGIHHIYNVAGLFFQINKSLKPGGILFLHEWIGPEKLQIPRANAWVASLLLCALFTKKERTNHEKKLKGRFLQYPPSTFDPSEACNSLEIPAQMEKYFEVKSQFAYGALCYPMFEGLGRNFNPKRWWDRVRIDFVIAVEQVLTKLRLIQPLFLVAFAKKRDVWE